MSEATTFSLPKANYDNGENSDGSNARIKRKRRRKLAAFKIPVRIWEESEDGGVAGSSDEETVVNAEGRGGSNRVTSPSAEQSLAHFMPSEMFGHTNTELDRENAHFKMAEAMIAIIEQMKCNYKIKKLQKRSNPNCEYLGGKFDCVNMDSDAFSGNLTTDQSVNSLTSSVYSTSEDNFSTDQEECGESGTLIFSTTAGMSISQTSLDSNNLDAVSAAGIGRSILRLFDASEIEFLVSQEDAKGQMLLPLPKEVDAVRLRGDYEWAPPRDFHLILTQHLAPIKSYAMKLQNYRCAGCGIEVDKKYVSKFRYCEYFGKYFCTASGCHNKQIAIIPGKILAKWDFKKYSVSNFAYNFLERISKEPLFDIKSLNPSLYLKIRGFEKLRQMRIMLHYLKDYVLSCKYNDSILKDVLLKEPPHIISDPECYSLQDLISVKDGHMFKKIKEYVKAAESHVNQCQLCQLNGFICEMCGDEVIIFPWNLQNVLRCKVCGSCYHLKCFKQKALCPKCKRKDERKLSMLEDS